MILDPAGWQCPMSALSKFRAISAAAGRPCTGSSHCRQLWVSTHQASPALPLDAHSFNRSVIQSSIHPINIQLMCGFMQWAEALALQGDEADGVPGVQRVGTTTATRLLQAFGSIDGLQQNAHKVRCHAAECLHGASCRQAGAFCMLLGGNARQV